MGTWSVTPSTNVTNNNNGTFVFPRNDTGIDINYRIKYVNDDGTCTPETTYTVAACPVPEVTCNCNDFWLEDNSPVTVGNAQGSYEIRKIRFSDGKESCFNKLHVISTNCTYDGETWLTAVTSSITNENYVVFSALTANPDVTKPRGCGVGFNFDATDNTPCSSRIISVSQNKKDEPTETFTFNNKILFNIMPTSTVYSAWFDDLYVMLTIYKTDNETPLYSKNLSTSRCSCGCNNGENRNPYIRDDFSYSVICKRSELSNYRLKIEMAAGENVAREAYNGGENIKCTGKITSIISSVTGGYLNKDNNTYIFDESLSNTNIICGNSSCPIIQFTFNIDFT